MSASSAGVPPPPPRLSDEAWAAARGYSKDGLGVTTVDLNLLPHAEHLRQRWRKFVERMRALEVRLSPSQLASLVPLQLAHAASSVPGARGRAGELRAGARARAPRAALHD